VTKPLGSPLPTTPCPTGRLGSGDIGLRLPDTFDMRCAPNRARRLKAFLGTHLLCLMIIIASSDYGGDIGLTGRPLIGEDRKMTFADYITSCRVTDTPRGDFIEDTRVLIRTGKLPNLRSWDQLQSLMRSRGACSEAIDEGRKVWRQYESKRDAEIEALM
jgi:hypothetical protein